MCPRCSSTSEHSSALDRFSAILSESVCEVIDRITVAAKEHDYDPPRRSAAKVRRDISDNKMGNLEVSCKSKRVETLPEAIDQTCRNPDLPPWRKENARTIVFVEEGDPEGANVSEDLGEEDDEVEVARGPPISDRGSTTCIGINVGVATG